MSFFEELKQRKVVRVATGYVVAAWIAVQAASIALPAFDAPPWVLRAFILLFMLGFPLALVLSWALDVAPDGIKVSERGTGSGKMALLALVLITLSLGWYWFSASWPPATHTGATANPAPPPPTARHTSTPIPAASPLASTAPTTIPPARQTPATATQTAAAKAPPETPRTSPLPPPPKARTEAPKPTSVASENAPGDCAALKARLRETARERVASGQGGLLLRREAMRRLREAGCLENLQPASPGHRVRR